MKTLALIFSLALASSVFGQAVHRSFGSVVFPGGTSTTSPGIQRNFGSAVFPGGAQRPPVTGGSPVVGTRPIVGGGVFVPAGNQGTTNFHRPPVNGNGRGMRNTSQFVYAYPVYIGGGYDNSYAPQDQPNGQPYAAGYPQQPPTPIIIQMAPEGGGYTTLVPREAPRQGTIYEAPRQADSVDQPEPPAESARYLLAFKDHTIYSAVAYWADGDTLHYFTTGNVHNQASLSLIDRPLTERLNRELGIDFKLPPAK